MNENFDEFKATGTSGKDINIPNSSNIFANWIIQTYKEKTESQHKISKQALTTSSEEHGRNKEKYENNLSNPASDRYMALIYPEMATAADYIPENAVVVLCDHSSLQRSAKNRSDEMGMQLDSMLQAGLSCCRKPRILLVNYQDLISQMRILRVYKLI